MGCRLISGWLGWWTAGTTVTSIQASNILDIGFRSTSPEAARQIADAIGRAYVEQSIVFRNQVSASNADWFRRQADGIKVELTKAERKKSSFEKAQNIVLQDDSSDPDSARLRALAGTPPPPTMGVSTVTATPSAALLAQVDAQLSSASQMLGPNHPEIVALQRQRVALAATAAQERAAALATARAAASTGPSIASQVAAQQSKVLAQRDDVDTLRKMQARVRVLRDQYEKTMQRAADLGLLANSRDSGVTLLGVATAPDKPISPKVGLILIGSIVIGLVLGIAIAVLLELLTRRVRGAEDLEELDVPVIGSMPPSNDNRSELPAWNWRRLMNPA